MWDDGFVLLFFVVVFIKYVVEVWKFFVFSRMCVRLRCVGRLFGLSLISVLRVV